jgi:hypothetical protein
VTIASQLNQFQPTTLHLQLEVCRVSRQAQMLDTIDVFVRRTLVYTLLTGILIVVYVGMIVGSQLVIATFSSQAAQSPLILVASTLVIAALFQPLRHRIQRGIDRRFYRRKYDAAKTIAAFSATLRNEVDLDELREHLLAVVQETMQPMHVSLWVRSQEQHSGNLSRTAGPHDR